MIEEAEWQALWSRTADKAVLNECQRLTGLAPNLTAANNVQRYRL